MISPELIAGLSIAIPAIFIAYVAFFFRRRPIFWFVIALVLVGLGYLYSTGALREIGISIMGDVELIEQGR
jgi:hypothetical protein